MGKDREERRQEGDVDLRFNCEKCGACCKTVKCKMLTQDNLCAIYDIRPEICKVKKDFELSKKCCGILRRNLWIQ